MTAGGIKCPGILHLQLLRRWGYVKLYATHIFRKGPMSPETTFAGREHTKL